jgi:hypothetical protein
MSSGLTLYLYLIAALAGAVVLFLFRPKSWYLHAIGVALGAMAGLMPPIGDDPETFYLVAGCAFFFFVVWGLCGLVFRRTAVHLHENPTARALGDSQNGVSRAKEQRLSSLGARYGR